MARTRTLRIHRYLRATTGTAILAITLLGLLGFEWIRSADREALIREKAELLADSVVTALNHALRNDRSELDPEVRRLLDIPDLIALAAYDEAGHQLSLCSKINQIDEKLTFDPNVAAFQMVPTLSKRTRLHSYDRIETPNEAAGADARLERVFMRTGSWLPQKIQYVGLLAHLEPERSTVRDWAPSVVMLIAAAIAVFAVDRRLRRDIVDPLRSLGRASKSNSAPTIESESVTQPDTPPLTNDATGPISLTELQALSEKLVGLEHDARRWRQHAQIIERRVDTHIARETTKIVRDLHRIQRESWVDSLTGVRNRKFLEEKFPPIFTAQLETRRDLSVIMIDLDNFKVLNDTQGHGAGDDVLRFVGELLQQCLRGDDLAVRYGGDEFIAILPGVTAEDAVVLAERLLALFSQRVKTMFKMSVLPTMTAGVASIDRNRTAAPAELLACADHALLAAKQAGKRRAKIATVRGDHFRNAARSMRIQLRASTPVAAHL